MTGFEELVERARRELAATPSTPGAADGEAPDLEGLAVELRARGEATRLELASHLAELERSSRPLELRPDEATTPVRRALGSAVRGLLRLGGLGKFLGSTQWRANQAMLRSLRLLEARSQDQDRSLVELLRVLKERERGQHRADPPR